MEIPQFAGDALHKVRGCRATGIERAHLFEGPKCNPDYAERAPTAVAATRTGSTKWPQTCSGPVTGQCASRTERKAASSRSGCLCACTEGGTAYGPNAMTVRRGPARFNGPRRPRQGRRTLIMPMTLGWSSWPPDTRPFLWFRPPRRPGWRNELTRASRAPARSVRAWWPRVPGDHQDRWGTIVASFRKGRCGRQNRTVAYQSPNVVVEGSP